MADPLSLEDRYAIRELYARYAWAMDSGDLDAFEENFAPGALLSDRFGVGQTDLRAWERTFLEDAAFPGSQHFYSQFVIEGDRDRAYVRAYVTRLYQVPGTRTSEVIWQGYYTDECVRRHHRWLIAVKRIHQAPELLGRRMNDRDDLHARGQRTSTDVHDLGRGRR